MSTDPRSSRLASVVVNAADAIFCTDLAGAITDWNAAAQALFGHAEQEVLGTPAGALLPGLHEAAARGNVETVLAGTTRDGRHVDLSITVSNMRDALGKMIGKAYIARDVTARHREEARLRKNEARLRFSLEAAEIGSWRLEVNTGEVQRSLAHDRCFGYARLLPEWSVATFERHLHPEDRPEVMNRLRKAIANEGAFRAECRVVWPDESVHWIVTHGTMAYGIDTAPSMTGIIVDVTRRKQAETARANAAMLETENRRIVDSSKAKSIFLANMSHELRTPLNAILGFSDVLASGLLAADPPRTAIFLSHIQTSGRHLLQLINDVLDLSKVEAGKLEFDPEPIDLAALVGEVVDVMHTQLSRKRLNIEVDIAPELGELFLDPIRLKQILFNYLSNAIKFTPADGDITIRAKPHGPAHLRIEVQDTGVGIAPEDQERLFIEFSQIDNASSGQQEGTGLGLALTRQLALAQGGRVDVASELGIGSVFSLTLNRVHGTDTPQPLEPAVASENDAPRLLVVHDGPKERVAFTRGLRDAGMAISWAGSSEQAIECLRSHSFDALALQLMLPDRRGLPLLADVRRRQWAGDMPVVGLMVHDGTGRTACFAIADVLAKPLRAQQIKAILPHTGLHMPPWKKVLLIDDERASLDLMEAILLERGITALCQADGGAALADIEHHRPDAILLSLMTSGMNGLDILARIRELPRHRHIPVFICTSMALSESDYETLRYAASAILNRGGGLADAAIAGMMHSLRELAGHRHAPH